MAYKRKALYGGTFDPITAGHLWMIERGAEVFDELIVAIGVNPSKRWTFSVDERRVMIEKSVQDMQHVTVTSFKNQYLVHYAREVRADVIIRGLRNTGDFESEHTMRHINEDLAPDITTWFLMPPREIAQVSSSMVKGLIGPDGWEDIVAQYVPTPVLTKLKEKYDANGNRKRDA